MDFVKSIMVANLKCSMSVHQDGTREPAAVFLAHERYMKESERQKSGSTKVTTTTTKARGGLLLCTNKWCKDAFEDLKQFNREQWRGIISRTMIPYAAGDTNPRTNKMTDIKGYKRRAKRFSSKKRKKVVTPNSESA
jgi:hypothetical protein